MSLNLIIIVLTILVSINAQNNMNLYSQLMMKPYEVMKRRQYWRFLTSGFVHDGYSHLGFNMFTLYFFGGAVEQYFGYILGSASTIVFIFFYLSALIVSDLPGYLNLFQNPCLFILSRVFHIKIRENLKFGLKRWTRTQDKPKY